MNTRCLHTNFRLLMLVFKYGYLFFNSGRKLQPNFQITIMISSENINRPSPVLFMRKLAGLSVPKDRLAQAEDFCLPGFERQPGICERKYACKSSLEQPYVSKGILPVNPTRNSLMYAKGILPPTRKWSGLIIQNGAQPSFHFRDFHILSGSVVFHLVPVDFPNTKVFAFGICKVPAAN